MAKTTPLTPILYKKILGSGGGGGSVTAAAVLAAMQAMDSTQEQAALVAIGASPAPDIVTDLSSTSITLSAAANTYYTYGTLTSLTISSFPASGTFWIVFESGATATTVTGIDNADGTPFSPEANKRYKITVEDGYASFLAWSVGGGS